MADISLTDIFNMPLWVFIIFLLVTIFLLLFSIYTGREVKFFPPSIGQGLPLTVKLSKMTKNDKISQSIGDNNYFSSYPEKINNVIREQIEKRLFYKENVVYTLTVDDILDRTIVLTTELKYNVVNRTNQDQEWKIQYNLKSNEPKTLSVLVNNKEINTQVLEVVNGLGLNIPLTLKPTQNVNVVIKVKEEYRKNDFELFTSYHPATDLELIVNNSFKNIKFNTEIFYFNSIFPEIYQDKLKIVFNEGVLPYQGVRLNWVTNNLELI